MSIIALAAALQIAAVPGIAAPPPIVPASSALSSAGLHGTSYGDPADRRLGARVSPNPSPSNDIRLSIDPRSQLRATEDAFDRR